MLVIKRCLLLLVLFILCLSNLWAEEFKYTVTADNENKMSFYAGINPWALIAFLPNGIGNVGTLLGVASGQEFGISLYGGMIFAKAHSLELRISTGPGSLAIWDTQIQFGYIWYPLQHFMDWDGGLTAGLMLRQFFWHNRITGYNIYNITPELVFGWRFKRNSLAFDLRGGWNIASVVWSNMPNTKAATGWLSFPFNLNIITGISWLF